MDLRKGKGSNPIHYITQSAKILPLSVLLLSCIFFINHFKLADYFPIRTVRIYGAPHIDQNEVQRILLPLLEKGFFAANVESIRDRIKRMPWVASVIVKRAWPDRVEITVLEKRAAARWNTHSLLTENGELFIPPQETFPNKLPNFVGPMGKQIMVLDYFNKINRLLLPLRAKIFYLELTPYLTWKLKLNNGITLHIGHKDILTRLDQFVKVYPKIVGNRATDVDYIDLRYANGLAVRWKVDINA